jgi:hypothetical protein
MQTYEIYNDKAPDKHCSMKKPLNVCGHYQEHAGLLLGHLHILLWSQNSLFSRKATLSLDKKEEQKKPRASRTMKER